MPTIFKDVVTVGALTFNDPANLPANAQAWGVDVLDGWDNTPDPEVLTTELSNVRDGSASADFWPVRARFVTIGGYVKAPNRSAARVLADSIVAGIPRNQTVTLARAESPTRSIVCRRSSGFEFDWPLHSGFRWQTTVRADDPLKYALTGTQFVGGAASVSTGGVKFPIQFPVQFNSTAANQGGIAVVNSGSAPTPRWVASLTGPLSRGAWRLRNDTNGGEISFDTAVLATDVLTIDFAARQGYLNGYPINSKITGDFFKLEPGTNTIRLGAEYSASITVTINVFSAWE